MKLLLLQYLHGLRERAELDALLPDLLSQMGLRVYSRPGRGTRQYGVDIGAAGSQDGGEEYVYLFSIKAGDLDRNEWQGGKQALRQSLEEILEVYVPTHLPSEYAHKKIIIVTCLGGSIKEDVALHLTQFEVKHTSDRVSFQRWNGDRLADLIERHLLNEHLVPADVRAHLRKAIALIEEPDAASASFLALAWHFSRASYPSPKERSAAIRTLAVCVWVLLSWSREGETLETALRASEMALLHGWELSKPDLLQGGEPRVPSEPMHFLLNAYLRVQLEYLKKVAGSASVYYGLSSSVRSDAPVDVNLAMFKLMGRLATIGLWQHWAAQLQGDSAPTAGWHETCRIIQAVVDNNPILETPIQDDQIVDIGLVCLLMSLDDQYTPFLTAYLSEVVSSSLLAMRINGPFPCVLSDYYELSRHPQSTDTEYIQRCTTSSVLYPTIAMWAALLEHSDTYDAIRSAQESTLRHCAFQVWSPDRDTEANLYVDRAPHGTEYCQVKLPPKAEEFCAFIWKECDAMPEIKSLTCMQNGWYPILLTACRRYRYPIPFHFTNGYRKSDEIGKEESTATP